MDKLSSKIKKLCKELKISINECKFDYCKQFNSDIVLTGCNENVSIQFYNKKSFSILVDDLLIVIRYGRYTIHTYSDEDPEQKYLKIPCDIKSKDEFFNYSLYHDTGELDFIDVRRLHKIFFLVKKLLRKMKIL